MEFCFFVPIIHIGPLNCLIYILCFTTFHHPLPPVFFHDPLLFLHFCNISQVLHSSFNKFLNYSIDLSPFCLLPPSYLTLLYAFLPSQISTSYHQSSVSGITNLSNAKHVIPTSIHPFVSPSSLSACLSCHVNHSSLSHTTVSIFLLI